MTATQEAIARLTDDHPLTDEMAGRVAEEILAGSATPAQIASFLTALRIRGEQAGHLLAFARTLRDHATTVPVKDRENLVDTCGTGGDHSGTFNISTTAALIAAGAGARVAKHGNRAITGKCGSADVLKALGVNVEMSPAVAVRCLNEAGCSFFFAPSFHGAMRHAGSVRREIGIRTIFNMLGPLCNPAGASRQLIGVYDRKLIGMFADVLLRLGSVHALIVHGSDGLDEITTTGPTDVAEVKNGTIKADKITPEALGLSRASAEQLRGGTAEENAETIRAILRGGKGPKRDIAELNAAATLVVAGKADALAEGLAQARKAVDSGSASATLQKLAELSNRD